MEVGTSMSRRFLQQRYDIRGEEENASRHRCEERKMLRLLEMTRSLFGKAGLNVVTNGILWDSLLMEVFIFYFSLYIRFSTRRNFLYFCLPIMSHILPFQCSPRGRLVLSNGNIGH